LLHLVRKKSLGFDIRAIFFAKSRVVAGFVKGLGPGGSCWGGRRK